MQLKPGDPAPGFTLTTHSGEQLSLAQLRGKKVLIWFYPEADTPDCTIEGCGFRDHQAYFDEYQIVVLGASFNSVEENAAFASRHSFKFRLLSDPERTLGRAYGACGDAKARQPDRISILIDEAGQVARIYDSVNPRGHAAQILADIIEE